MGFIGEAIRISLTNFDVTLTDVNRRLYSLLLLSFSIVELRSALWTIRYSHSKMYKLRLCDF